MKTIGRILVILVVFVLVMGITYTVVNTSSSSPTAPAFERGEGFPRPDGVRPEFPNGERPDFDRDGGRGGGWVFGFLKSTATLAIIVALIVVPKNLIGRKPVPVRAK